jgi:SAM-dependent methyltransferase
MIEAEVPAWSADRISDEHYRACFIDVPPIVAGWLADHGGLSNRDILDFGCGFGIAALSIALREPTARVVGLDIMPDVTQCLQRASEQIGLQRLPSNLSLYQVTPGQPPASFGRFDIIYSWSTFEHIDQRLLPEIVSQLRQALKPGGKLFVQIAPLYYSSEGSHLLPWIPERWGHLSNQHDIYREKLQQAVNHEKVAFDSLWSMYSTLNRLTAEQLVRAVVSGGFSIIRQSCSREEHEIPQGLLDVYMEEALRTFQIVLLAEPADPHGPKEVLPPVQLGAATEPAAAREPMRLQAWARKLVKRIFH